MTERFCIGYFEDEHDVVRAATASRRRGHRVLDVFSPYPVHGLAEAVGLGPSRLVWIGVWAGVAGLVLGLTLQFWTSGYDWPLIVGGQPFNAWPVFIPVSFELTVLFAGVIGVAALLVRTKLWPGGRPPILDRVANDRFAVVLMQSDASVDPEEMMATLREHGAVEVVEGAEIA
ncbi:MAG: DUF3341 domain-containing protein [Armatimonadota bacterium]